MIFIPAIDLKNNECVRLTKGKRDSVRVYNSNPIEQAKFFENEGCERIHIVDLDAAFGNSGINRKTILDIRQSTKLEIELGGGIKNQEDVLFWIKNKIDFLVIGSLAVRDVKQTLSIVSNFNKKIYISLDYINDKVMIDGWEQESKYHVKDIVNIYDKSNIRGYIATDVSRDGMMQGMNIDQLNKNLLLTNKPTIVGGGLSNYEDLYSLKNLKLNNLEGVIAGKAFYSGNIEIKKGMQAII